MTSEPICNLCGCKEFKIIENDEVPYKVLGCKICSLVFVYPQPTNQELAVHYNEDYYHEWAGPQKQKRAKMWNLRLNKMEKFRQAGRLLDVGCGEGAFLHLAKKRGWQIAGTELSTYAARRASNILEADIFCGELFDADYPEKHFDVVTLWHVLEHVRDPVKYLFEVRRVIKSDGLLVIAVPNVNDLVMQFAYRLIRGRKMKLYSREDREVHLYHFSFETLVKYLRKAGFNCLRYGPDFGIVETSKKGINLLAAALFYISGMKIFNAIEAYAVPESSVN